MLYTSQVAEFSTFKHYQLALKQLRVVFEAFSEEMDRVAHGKCFSRYAVEHLVLFSMRKTEYVVNPSGGRRC